MRTLLLIVLLGLTACGNGSLLETIPPNTSTTAGTFELKAVHESTQVFTNNLGFLITVMEGSLAWKSLQLISGGADDDCEAGHDQTLTLNATENLLNADVATIDLGDFPIPMIAYCRYALIIAPVLGGTWSKGEALGTFHIAPGDTTIAGTFQATENGAVIEHPLHFHADTTAEKTFRTEYDLLFHNIDFTTMDAAAVTTQAVANLPAAVHQQMAHD